MIVLLIALVVVPIAAWLYARRSAPQFSATIAAVAFGLVVSPVSMGLHGTYFLGPLNIVAAMIGLASAMFHGAPGFYIVRSLDLVPPGVIEGFGHLYVELVNGLVWAAIYGTLGWLIDRARRSRVAL